MTFLLFNVDTLEAFPLSLRVVAAPLGKKEVHIQLQQGRRTYNITVRVHLSTHIPYSFE